MSTLPEFKAAEPVRWETLVAITYGIGLTFALAWLTGVEWKPALVGAVVAALAQLRAAERARSGVTPDAHLESGENA